MGVAQVPHGKTSPWPRCRWCHAEIKPSKSVMADQPDNWYHVATGRVQCEGRSNNAEPMPALQEEPFIAAVYEFVDKHRKLRRSFREISQSRASALRRLNDYHELVDALAAALEKYPNGSGTVLFEAQKLVDYRHSTIAAGWR